MVALLDPRLDVDAARALLNMPVADAEASIDEAWSARNHRRMMREPKRRSGPQPRCSACCRFKASSSATCVCGFTPGYGYPR